MRLVSAQKKQSALTRAATILCALAMAIYGVTAVAQTAQAQTINSGGPYAVSNAGGDVTTSIDVAGVSTANEQAFVNSLWPQAVGLGSNPALNTLFQTTWQHYSGVFNQYSPDAAAEDPQPPAFAGGSITVTSDGSGGSTVSLDVPASDVTANSSVPGWLQGVLAQFAGAAAAALIGGLCTAGFLAFGGPLLVASAGTAAAALTPLAGSICGGLGSGTWTLVASLVGQAFSGKPWTADAWKTIIASSVGAAIAGAGSGILVAKLSPAFGRVLSRVATAVGNGVTNFFAFIAKWAGKAFTALSNGARRLFSRAQTEIETELPNIEAGAGLPRPDSSGSFHTAPTGQTPPGTPVGVSCMDAYGATDANAAPGNKVAINSCNGSAAQDWDVYANGQVAVLGLCLATTGGTALVTLQGCDGSTNQTWTASGSALVNKATGNCLDDPNSNTAAGTQLQVFTCNGGNNQKWLNPAAGPCDIYAFYGTACVATYSMDRALYETYNGPLYQVQRASDNTTANIGLLNPGGDVNAGTQDTFCAKTTCTITEIYDQSPRGNNLTVEGPGGAGGQDHAANATALPIKINGNEAYGLDVEKGVGYRDDVTDGVATDGEPEGMYMVASGTHVNSGCCYDFGNAEANNKDTGNGHMDAVNLGTECYFAPCSGSGPWVEADMENGLFSGANGSNLANKGNGTNFVTALLKNDGQTKYALKGGDSQTGGLSTWWSGALPNLGGYTPMQQEGAVVLGTGGDNSNSSIGSFFEGVMTAGYPTDAADDAVQASIVAAKYTGSSNPMPGSGVAANSTSAGLVHAGYTSVYTVNSSNNHLQESYLTAIGQPWATQDLSAKYGTPQVMLGTKPVSVVHDGYDSVYTVDAGSGDLQETYLPAIGQSWSTQDLSVKYGTPRVEMGTSPTTVVHDGYTSVYTVDASNNHLQETYLTAMGQPWHTQDLSANYGTPAVLAGTSPTTIVHDSYTSVWTIDGNHDLQETYLPALGGPWSTHDLSTKYGTPASTVNPTVVVHDGYVSVYTVDHSNNHLQETYLTAIGQPWATQDLSNNYGTPAVAAGTEPESLSHTGYTSVYTVDRGSLHVQETYLPALGGPWSTQDLSTKYGTPATAETPVVLTHPGENSTITYTSVYTVDELNAHLQETYLQAIGESWATQDLSAKYGTPPVAESQFPTASWSTVHDGYTSAYTVDSSNGHLQETYLTAMGQPWATQDLSAKYGTPPVILASAPVVVTHAGYTSVYTVDASNRHLQETYLTALGQPWATQDLSAKYGTPVVASLTTPTAVVHDGYVSVYTSDDGSGDLQETYLPAIGQSWSTQDLTTKYGTPPISASSSPSAIVHSGYTSVYTVDKNSRDLQETYLPAMGAAWSTQDLTAKYGTPALASVSSPEALLHNGFTSVYTVDNGSNHLQETYLPAMGDAWSTQDLSANYGTPAVAGGTSPAALVHTGYTSVYTVDASSNHVQETYLTADGNPWATQDLSSKYGTPSANQTPSVLAHPDTNGALTYTSVYSVDTSTTDLQETYLSNIGNSWATQDLSAKYGTPPV